MGERLRNWLLGALPQSLAHLLLRPRGPVSKRTAGLYILEVDFKVTKEVAEGIDKALTPVREKYGVDFIVLEPGMRLRRFNDV